MATNKAEENIVHKETLSEPQGIPIPGVDHDAELEPSLHSKTLLIVLTMSFVSVALLIQLVATGAFNSVVALAVGGAEISDWMLSALTITFVALAPPISQAADYWGRRWFVIVLCMTGFVGTIITSRANSMGVAILGEVFVGASFAVTPLTFAIVSEVLPHRHRLTGQACINGAGGLGAVFSLLLGSHLIQTNGPEGFRILWYINAGVFVVAAILTFLLYRPPVRELQTSLTTKEKFFQLDWAGYGLIVSAAVLFVVGLSWAENPYSWKNAHVLAPLIIGTVLFCLLGGYSWKIRKDGLIHLDLFSRNRNLALSLVSVLLEGLVFGTANIYVPFQLTVVYGLGSFKVALIYSLSLMVYTAASPVAALICFRYKQVRSLNTAGFCAFLIFCACMATSSVKHETAMWGFQVFLGVGLSLVLCSIVTAAQLSAPPALISIASGLMAAIRSLGVTCAVAISAAIFNTKISKLLPAKVSHAALSNGLPSASLGRFIGDLTSQNTDDMMKIPGITPKIIQASVAALQDAYLDSFHAVWYAASAFAAVGLIVSLFFLNPSKDLNNQIDAPAETEEELYGK